MISTESGDRRDRRREPTRARGSLEDLLAVHPRQSPSAPAVAGASSSRSTGGGSGCSRPAARDPRDPVAGGEHEVEQRRAEADQGLEAGASRSCWGRGAPARRSAALVEEEPGQRALDHFLGHPLGDLEVAGAHRDVVEGDDPDRRSPSTIGSRRTRCWTISAAASSRSISGSPVTSGRDSGRRPARRRALLGERAHGQVAVGDHRRRLSPPRRRSRPSRRVVAHQLGDGEHVGVRPGGHHARGHDLAKLHGGERYPG